MLLISYNHFMKLITLLFLSQILIFADTGTLIKIVDGDTLNFKTNNEIVKCRIRYIDTPESSLNKKLKKDTKNCSIKDKDMKAAGKSATRSAKRLLKIGKQYNYHVSSKDRYKRSICVVDLDNTTFNEAMILNGYAVPYRHYMNKSELQHYEGLLQKAQQNKAGLWSTQPEVIECLYRARK